ncbi:hypothetical protein GCM10022226_59950 [Sphaerisporangium flaviroseum]|uniref:Uncharacterized protein n=1 Tax=Sphaerisporangium flaviroseum TaxID=509199 RepID=A0ABP7J0S7_9ACTN
MEMVEASSRRLQCFLPEFGQLFAGALGHLDYRGSDQVLPDRLVRDGQFKDALQDEERRLDCGRTVALVQVTYPRLDVRGQDALHLPPRETPG